MFNDSLLRIAEKKLTSDVSRLVFYPFGSDIWIFDIDLRIWVMYYENCGRLSYNVNYFNDIFRFFNLGHLEYQKILKSWFIKNFEIHVLSVHRNNTDYKYILDAVVGSTKQSWDLKNRYGYSYGVVKRFLDLDKTKKNYVEINEYFQSKQNPETKTNIPSENIIIPLH
jgi:hypothetical protein